jgi:hypothetical protein
MKNAYTKIVLPSISLMSRMKDPQYFHLFPMLVYSSLHFNAGRSDIKA